VLYCRRPEPELEELVSGDVALLTNGDRRDRDIDGVARAIWGHL
jgi:hypothetical protein